MNNVIVELAADQTKTELIAEYKKILQTNINRRPSGTRKKIANALKKNKSFVSQITNPSYSTPIPAVHLTTIFDVCNFSNNDRELFLRAYIAAHPDYHYRIESLEGNQVEKHDLIIEVPILEDAAQQYKIEAMIKDYAQKLFDLVQNKK